MRQNDGEARKTKYIPLKQQLFTVLLVKLVIGSVFFLQYECYSLKYSSEGYFEPHGDILISKSNQTSAFQHNIYRMRKFIELIQRVQNTKIFNIVTNRCFFFFLQNKMCNSFHGISKNLSASSLFKKRLFTSSLLVNVDIASRWLRWQCV